MQITVLDGYTLNPGDLTWDALSTLGTVTVHDRTPPEQVQQRAQGADIILTNKTVLNREVIGSLPQLKYIGVLATGYNVVDIETARDRDILVTNVPSYSTDSVAQHTFALLLELCRHVGAHSDAVRAGTWTQTPDFCFWNTPQVELSGRTMGIVGPGEIGRQTATLARAFGMRVIACGRNPVEGIDLNTLLRESDVVSLHCPLTPDTEGLMNRNTLALMHPDAFLLNTARGPLIVEQDLADVLNEGRLAGAGLDVLTQEPPPADNPLLSAKNCIVTPHLAWATRAARQRLMDVAADNVAAFIKGTPKNLIPSPA